VSVKVVHKTDDGSISYFGNLMGVAADGTLISATELRDRTR
jgi:hypothetical protein